MEWCLDDWDNGITLVIMKNICCAIQQGHDSRLILFEALLANGRSRRLSRSADFNM
jgi:hypothetical protein